MNKMLADRYMLVKALGEGGMADVYLAVDTILNREVAIKMLRGELSHDPVTLLRFQREASAACKLNHPNVVDVYDVGESEGRHYIVMEYVRGRTLKQLISQRGAIDKKEAVDIMCQLTSAVEHAHKNDIIHRDIKPQNILVKDDGTVKITDFGIAFAHDAVQLTQNDAVLGSAHYLAPETTRGETATNQIDIYALGIVFYELLSGTVPFKGENPVQIAMKHLREEMPLITDFNPTVPQSIENIILKATVKNRRLRYQSAAEMLQDLKNCLKPEYANVKRIKLEEKEIEPTVLFQERSPSTKSKIEHQETQKTATKKYKSLWILLTVVIVILSAIGIYFSNILPFFSHAKYYVLPDVSGMREEKAKAELLSMGLQEDHIVIETALSDDVEAGYVISITPEAGSEVRDDETITIHVSRGLFATIENYQGRNIVEVEKELKEMFEDIDITIEKRADPNYAEGMILSQEGVTVGEKVDPSDSIHITFVVADAPQVEIKDIVGLPVEEAKTRLDAYGVAVVTMQKSTIGMTQEEIDALEKGIVVEVSPEEGTLFIQEGTSNYITLYYY